jgi:hypothetical protein
MPRLYVVDCRGMPRFYVEDRRSALTAVLRLPAFRPERC